MSKLPHVIVQNTRTGVKSFKLYKKTRTHTLIILYQLSLQKLLRNSQHEWNIVGSFTIVPLFILTCLHREKFFINKSPKSFFYKTDRKSWDKLFEFSTLISHQLKRQRTAFELLQCRGKGENALRNSRQGKLHKSLRSSSKQFHDKRAVITCLIRCNSLASSTSPRSSQLCEKSNLLNSLKN